MNTNNFPIRKRLTAPCKNKIRKHWAEKYKNNYYLENKDCWGCGCSSLTQRAHLHADHCGGSNDPDNFILLCKFCHDHIQEKWTDTKENAEVMRQIILNDESPFMQININFIFNLCQQNLYPQAVIDFGKAEMQKPRSLKWLKCKNLDH